MVVHIYSPVLQRQSQEGHEFKTSLERYSKILSQKEVGLNWL